MTLTITHPFQSSKAQSSDSTLVSKNAWNESHSVRMSGLALIGRTAQGDGDAADIIASSGSGYVMREEGGTIGWGTIGVGALGGSALATSMLMSFSGAHSTAGGAKGLVPAPTSTNFNAYDLLLPGGSWGRPQNIFSTSNIGTMYLVPSYSTSTPPTIGVFAEDSGGRIGLAENSTNILRSVSITGIADPSTGVGAGAAGRMVGMLNENWFQDANFHWIRSTDNTIYPGQISVRGGWILGDVAKFVLGFGGSTFTFSYTVASVSNAVIAAALNQLMASNSVFAAQQIYTQAVFNSSSNFYDWHWVPKYSHYPVSFTNLSTAASTGSIVEATNPANLLADPVGLYISRTVGGRTPVAGDFIGGLHWWGQVNSNSGVQVYARVDGYIDTPNSIGRVQIPTFDANVNGLLNRLIIRKGIYLSNSAGVAADGGTNGDYGAGFINVPGDGGYRIGARALLTYDIANSLAYLNLRNDGGVETRIQSQDTTGLVMGTLSAHPMYLITGGVARLVLSTSDLSPNANNAIDLGLVGTKYKKLYAIDIMGTSTNDNAAAGAYGERSSTNRSSANSVNLATDTSQNLASLSLGAGDWSVILHTFFAGGAATTINYFENGLSATSNVFDTSNDRNNVLPFGGLAALSANQRAKLSIGWSRFSLSSTATIYGIVRAGFGTSFLNAYGLMEAVRNR